MPSGIKPLFQTMLTKSYDKFYMTNTSFSEPYFFFYCNFWWYWCNIMWTALWNWMNFRMFIYQTDSFLFGHYYLFLSETVGNIWYMYLEELVQFDIPEHWIMTNFIFISFFYSVHRFFYTQTAIMHRTRAVRCQLIQWRDLEFNLLNDGHPGGVSW